MTSVGVEAPVRWGWEYCQRIFEGTTEGRTFESEVVPEGARTVGEKTWRVAALEWVHGAFDPDDVYNTTLVSVPGGRTRSNDVARRPRGASAEAPLAGRYFRGNQLRNVPCEGSAGICVTACEHGWE